MNKFPIILLAVLIVVACSPVPDAVTLVLGMLSVKEFPATGGLWVIPFFPQKPGAQRRTIRPFTEKYRIPVL